ncbi:MAG: hypothetical protein IJT50_17055 [Lentisphaeria bacterium]|nr:hypothetical protein [Lentisphaeria bacterium]
MKSSVRKIALIVLAVLVAEGLVVLAHYGYLWWNFARVTSISVVRADRAPVALDVPLRYAAADDIGEAAVCPMTAADGKVYALKKDPKSGRLLITRTVWGLGGFAVYHAAWEVTSPEIERKLRTLFRP